MTETPATPLSTPTKTSVKYSQQGSSNKTMLKIGGEVVEIHDSPTMVVAPETTITLYPHGNHAKLPEEKRIELFDSAMKQDDAKPFDLMLMTLDNEKILDETYDLTMRIRKMCERHTKFDMHNIFAMLELDNDGKQIVDTYDLYSKYAAISVDMVAKSNTWYNTYPKDPTYPRTLPSPLSI
jgi:hypothetical protein